MTLSTQTWRVSAKYAVTVAGASITIFEILAGIKAMFDGEDAIGNNYWTYAAGSYSNTTTQVMIMKRKGTPSGTLATFRAGLFSTNSTPSSSNQVSVDFTLNSNALYGVTSEDHNSDSVASVFTAGSVFSGKSSKMCLNPFGLSSNFSSTSGVKCFMVECDTMCSIWFVSSAVANAGAHFTFGEVAERIESANGIWGYVQSSGPMTAAQTGIETTVGVLLPVHSYAVATVVAGCYYCNLTGVARPWGRLNSIFHTVGLDDSTQNYDNTTSIVLPVYMASRRNSGGSQPQYTVGKLRQLRFGPRIQGQKIIKDTGATVTGYSVAPGYNVTSRSLYYDQSP